MQRAERMKRRQFIALGSGVGAALVATSGFVWLSIEPNKEPLTVAIAVAKISHLQQLIAHQDITVKGPWSVVNILNHCAQSVEFSMLGYPEQKSDFFKQTVGRIAFSSFSSKAKMSHNLAEAIPGAPALDNPNNIEHAVERLKQSLLNFAAYQGELKPHFAYGKLTKIQYEQAHVMHLNNHLMDININTELALLS